MADRRGAIMHLSGQALADLVKAPPGTEVADVRFDSYRNRVEVLLTGPAMPRWVEGALPHEISPIYTTRRHDCGHETVEVDWSHRRSSLGMPYTVDSTYHRNLEEGPRG